MAARKLLAWRGLLRMQQCDLQHRRDQVLEVLPAQFRIQVFASDDFALLGDANAGLDGAAGLRQNGLIARPASATDRPATSMEKPERTPRRRNTSISAISAL